MSAEQKARYRPGPTKVVPQMTPEQAAYFWDRVQRGAPDDCWLWTGTKSGAKGYGVFWLDGQSYPAHRLAYALANGPIPAAPSIMDSQVMHSCDNPPCVNPAHLSHGTNRDNTRDREAKDRMRMPEYLERCRATTLEGLAKARAEGRIGGRPPVVTPDKLEAAKRLRAEKGLSVPAVAAELGVGTSTLYRDLARDKRRSFARDSERTPT